MYDYMNYRGGIGPRKKKAKRKTTRRKSSKVCKSRKPKKISAWNRHVKATARAHPKWDFVQIVKAASRTYRGGAKTKRKTKRKSSKSRKSSGRYVPYTLAERNYWKQQTKLRAQGKPFKTNNRRY